MEKNCVYFIFSSFRLCKVVTKGAKKVVFLLALYHEKSMVAPSFHYIFIIFLTCYNSVPSFIKNCGRFFY